MDIIAFIISGFRILIGFFLILVAPGFLVSLLLFPKMSDIRLFERIVYSVVLSMGSVILLVLFFDVLLGLDIKPNVIVIGICGFCIVLSLFWAIRIFLKRILITERIFSIGNTFVRNGVVLVQKIPGEIKNRLRNLFAKREE